MGFLFPLFLLAGLALAIPVLIHLFNLRRYKRVNFPDTRFLRNIQLSTKRQSKIRNWRLLLLRMLFLAALVFAFAQPYLGGDRDKNTAATVSAIYIDNSYSMTIADGQESLLQKAKNKARQLISASGKDARFLLLTNDKMSAMRPMLRTEALQALSDVAPVAVSSSLRRLVASLNAAQVNEAKERWDVYCFTDLQQSTFLAEQGKIQVPPRTKFYVYPLAATTASNLYIDTAYFLSPNLDTRQPNPLVVKVKQSGSEQERSSNLQVSVGNQVRAVSTVDIRQDSLWTDTLPLQLSGNGWLDITIALQDHPLTFDDTFRIAARTAPDLSVLVVTENTMNPYLQAAFRTYEGFRVKEENAGAVHKEEWPRYGLVVLQNIAVLTPGLQVAVKEALQRGQNILLFPGNITAIESYNQALKTWGDISFEKADTSRQQVVTLQQAHPLLQDLFEKLPDNIQLPTTVSRYPINASLTAGQQSLMSFRDGKPFLAQYSLEQGKLYICASPLDDRSSNFAVSYFFVPMLYKMAVQSGGGNMYAMTIGSNVPMWLPVSGADDRKVWHLSRNGFDAIPAQRPSGIGVELFLNKAAGAAGFYQLHSEASKDTVLVGMNAARSESLLRCGSKANVEQMLQPAVVSWLDERSVAKHGWNKTAEPFPVWKVCVLIGLLCLGAETWMLIRKKQTTAAAGVTPANA